MTTAAGVAGALGGKGNSGDAGVPCMAAGASSSPLVLSDSRDGHVLPCMFL